MLGMPYCQPRSDEIPRSSSICINRSKENDQRRKMIASFLLLPHATMPRSATKSGDTGILLRLSSECENRLCYGYRLRKGEERARHGNYQRGQFSDPLPHLLLMKKPANEALRGQYHTQGNS